MADVIEEIVSELLGDIGIMSLVSDVGHLSVPQGTPTPYILVADVSEVPYYGFVNGQQAARWMVDIEIIAPLESKSKSGYSLCEEVLDRVEEIFQDKEGVIVADDGVTICLRRARRLPSRLITQSGNEQYLRRGHEWEVVTSRP